jgi:hypothetical protein
MSSKVVRRGVCSALGFVSVMMAGAVCAAAAAATPDADEAAVPKRGGHEALQLSLRASLVDYTKQSLKPDTSSESSTPPEDQKVEQHELWPDRFRPWLRRWLRLGSVATGCERAVRDDYAASCLAMI